MKLKQRSPAIMSSREAVRRKIREEGEKTNGGGSRKNTTWRIRGISWKGNHNTGIVKRFRDCKPHFQLRNIRVRAKRPISDVVILALASAAELLPHQESGVNKAQ